MYIYPYASELYSHFWLDIPKYLQFKVIEYFRRYIF